MDVGVICLGLLFALDYTRVEFSEHYMLLMTLAVILFEMLSAVHGIYRSWRMAKLLTELADVALVWCVDGVALILIGFASKTGGEFSRLAIGIWFVLVLLGLAAIRLAVRYFLKSIRADGRNSRTVAFAGCNKTSDKLARHIASQPWMGLRIVGVFDDRSPDRLASSCLNLVGNTSELIARAKAGSIDLVYVTLPMHAEKRIVELIDALADTTASVYVVPDIFVFDLFHAQWSTVGNLPVVSVFESPFYGVNGGVKRLEDVVLGSLILLLISPVMLIIALAIKLTSPGSVLFKQRRYGLNGEIVEVWKFRSMTVSDNGAMVVQARKNDARITPLGAFLRRTSLDELPQFINVLQGRMSIVGPRPHAVAHNEEYRGLLHGYMLRHKVKPGITGWAQVNGWRGETDTLDKMKGRLDCDLAYVRNWSLSFDLKIIFMTLFKGFVGKNVY